MIKKVLIAVCLMGVAAYGQESSKKTFVSPGGRNSAFWWTRRRSVEQKWKSES